MSGEIVAIIYKLLPGFVSAWIFYGLTAHPKKSEFDRLVQALILTALIQAIVVPFGWLCLACGSVYSLGVWNESTAYVWSVVVAIVFGLVFAVFANKNWLHCLLFKWKLTKRTSYPSEWFSAFNKDERYVVLHLTGENRRRLYGWPDEWPDQGDKGHFLMSDVEWLSEDNESSPVPNVDRMLIPASEVEMVEFVKYPKELVPAAEAPDKEE